MGKVTVTPVAKTRYGRMRNWLASQSDSDLRAGLASLKPDSDLRADVTGELSRRGASSQSAS